MEQAPEPEKKAVVKEITREQFAGDEACASCHRDIAATHLQTAHAKTSALASAKTILGSFSPANNSYAFNSGTRVDMEKRDSGYYQVEYINGVETHAQRFDISIGSGTMGQSFLSWRKQYLLQLPITYFSAAQQWSNSPGFPNRAVFNRPITSRCLECHTSFAKTISPPEQEPEQFDSGKFIFGVGCEKCHGPAAAHVAFQTSHPEDTIGQHILHPAQFSRQQKLDICAVCHGGRLQKTTASFQFTAGENLADYFLLDTTTPSPDKVDVHGNQYGLMRASKCFRLSETLTCNSCHNTHRNEKGQTALFSQRCQSCHSPTSHNFCTQKELPLNAITGNCIDCHMPARPSRAIAVFLPGNRFATAALIRSHYIGIYPEEAKKVQGQLRQ